MDGENNGSYWLRSQPVDATLPLLRSITVKAAWWLAFRATGNPLSGRHPVTSPRSAPFLAFSSSLVRGYRSAR